MAVIVKNPKLPDYFIEVNQGNAISRKTGIASFYEDGKLIVLKECFGEIDYDFINTISWENALEGLEEKDKNTIKKLPYQYILALDPKKLKKPLQQAIFHKKIPKNGSIAGSNGYMKSMPRYVRYSRSDR